VAVPLDTLPAIAGGRPIRGERRLDFAPPALGEEERANVLRSLETGWLTTGPFARRLESEFAVYADAPVALAVSSCTAAMYLALRALGIGEGEGDEVVTTPLTWPATANVIVRAGARPVFADVDPATLCLDPESVAAAITPRTRAIMPVHYAGQPADLAPLQALCDEHGLRLIEDAAHATEARLPDGRKIGSVGDVTCFSFYANKNLAAGEGGMLTLADEELAARITSLRLHGLTRDSWKRYEKKGPGAYDVLEPGYKLNLSDLHAGVALGQLHRIDEHHERRVAQAARYDEGLAELPGVTPLGRRLGPSGVHGWHIYVVQIDRDLAGADRDAYAEALGEEGIGTGLHFLPVHDLTYFRASHPTRPMPVAERAGAQVLSLPLSPAHSLADIDDVVAAVRRLHAHFAR
jgi:dTDP-4-amino-4,6-dideoxygalactose transaminase